MKKSDVGSFFKVDYKNEKHVLAWLMSGLFGVLSGLFLTFGYQLEKYGSVRLSDKNSLMIMLCIMAIMTMDSRYVWRSYDNRAEGKAPRERPERGR